MQTLENVIGKQENWANYITNVEMRNTIFLDWLPTGDKPTNPLYDYQVEKYRQPRENSHVDGEPWKNFGSAGENRGRLKALMQWFDETASVSRLSQDVTLDAAIEDQLAHEIPKKLKEMATDMEAAFLDDSDHREDNKAVGYKTRGVGSWVQSSAQSLYPVPAGFRPPSGSIVTTALASLTESEIRTMLQTAWNVAKDTVPMTGFVGLGLKAKFADFQYFIPTSASTQSTGVVSMNNVFKDKTIQRAVDTYKGDGYEVDLVLSPWNVALTGTATAKAGRGYFLHRQMWEQRWIQKPKVFKRNFEGGSYEAAMDAMTMLVCKNPSSEAKYAPA